jgi:tetratricopeptide (TPR) repeat protein
MLLVVLLISLIGLGLIMAGNSLRAWHTYRAAREAIEVGNYQEAAELLQKCLQAWPGDGQVHFLMARTARVLGEYDKAREHLAKCEELHWSSGAIEMEEILARAQQGEFPQFEETLIVWASQDNEDTATVLEILARHYASNSQIPQALYWGDKLLQRAPRNVNAIFAMARIHEAANHQTEALRYYRQAVQKLPENDNWRLALATALLRFGHFQEAVGEFEKVQEHAKAAEPVLFGLARCYRNLGRTTEATKLLHRLIDAHPNWWELWAERGQLALQKANRAEAEKCFRKAVGLYPHDPDTLYDLFLCLRQKGQRTQTEEERQIRARYLKIMDDRKRLNTLIAQEMPKQAANPAIAFEIATLFQRLGEEKPAMYWFQKTLQLRPLHLGARKALAAYHGKIGKTESANRVR